MEMIFKVCLIIANAICLAIADSKVAKFLNVLAIVLISISLCISFLAFLEV